LLTKSARDAGVVFLAGRWSFYKFRAADGSSAALISLHLKPEPAGRVPPDAILLSGNKSMQKCLLLAEGISLAGFLNTQLMTELSKPARYRGASLSV